MNSKFLITLKRVRYGRNAFPDAIEQLGKYSNKLQKTLQKYALKNNETLKQFAISDLQQITAEKKRIEDWHNTLSNKSRADLNALPYSEAVEYSKEMEYYGEILTLADSAINDLTEYLKVYFPEKAITIKPERSLQVPQIALIHAYERIQITRENASEIAAKYGYTAIKSGEGLFQDYEKYNKSIKRTAITKPFTQTKMENKIKLFESILNYLTDKAKQRAIDEIQILKTHYETEFL